MIITHADPTFESTSERRPLANVSTAELIGRFLKQMKELLKKELELAKAEIGITLHSVIAAAVSFILAGVCLFLALGFFLTGAVLALASRMPAWEASLIVGALMAVIGGIVFVIGKAKSIPKPLERTQKTLKENVRWVRERLA